MAVLSSQSIDKQQVARRFSRAAAGYDQHAVLQRKVARNLYGFLEKFPLAQSRVLEVGCGTGLLSDLLLSASPPTRLDLMDIAPAMVEHCRHKYADNGGVHCMVGDGEFPHPDQGPYDLIVSSTCFQWFADPGAAMARYRLLLRPGGWLCFATLIAGTFHELHSAFATAHAARGSKALQRHGQAMPTRADWERYLQAFSVSSLQEEELVYHYPDLISFLHSVRAVGAGNALPGKRPPLSRGLLRALEHSYANQFADARGLPVTYRILYAGATRNA